MPEAVIVSTARTPIGKAYRGGPMFQADRQGLGTVLADVWRTERPPTPLLKKLIGKGFGGWRREKANA